MRKKEADGGLRKRLFYAVQHSEGDWDVYAKEQALEMFHGQILNPLARKNRCFSEKIGQIPNVASGGRHFQPTSGERRFVCNCCKNKTPFSPTTTPTNHHKHMFFNLVIKLL